MEQKEKVRKNVMGSLRALEVGQTIVFTKEDMRPSCLRVQCCKMKDDYNMRLSVNKKNDLYYVTRYE